MDNERDRLVVNDRIQIPLSEITFTYARSRGTGGQNVNKVNSKAVLRWNPLDSLALPEDVRDRFFKRFSGKLTQDGDLIISSESFRDQVRNREDTLDKLKHFLLLVAEAPKPRKKTKPSKGVKRRRVKDKRAHGDKKTERRWRMGSDDAE